MAYNSKLADRVRAFLETKSNVKFEERKMFGGLAFMVQGKMCVNVSNNNLMCRFDSGLQAEVSKRKGFRTMIMKGRIYNGYCYVNEDGYNTQTDFEYWINLCLNFNDKAHASKNKKNKHTTTNEVA